MSNLKLSKIKTLLLSVSLCLVQIPSYNAQQQQQQQQSSGSYFSGRFRVQWTDSQSNVYFELRTNITSFSALYTAIGFSRDRVMGDDGVVYCTYAFNNAPSNKVVQAYNFAKSRPRLLSQSIPSIGITSASIRVENNQLVCSFQRAKSYGGVSDYFDLNSGLYYLLLSTGNTDSNNEPLQHNTAISTESQYNFRSAGYNSAPSGPIGTMKIYGYLITLAWILFSINGSLFAR